MSMDNWLDKYKPQKLSDVIGDKIQIQRVDNFIKQYDKKNIDYAKINAPNIIISGTNGIGKTLITDIVLKDHGFDKITADLSNISVARKTKKKKKAEKEPSGSNRTVKTYYMSLQSNKQLLSNGDFEHKKIALVFDDVSNISNAKEKEAIKSIVKLNNKLKKIPIIIIANTKHSKTVNELRKMVTYAIKSTTADGKKKNKKIINEIFLRPPHYNDIERFIKNICAKEKLNLVKKKTDDDDIYIELVNHAQYDIRRLVNILEELKLINGDSDVTLENFSKYRETSKTKDLDPGIYEATGMLLDNWCSIEKALSIYGEERATIPLMVHENYPNNIKHQYPKMSAETQINLIFDISKCISESDRVDGLIYSNQCWSLQPVHGYYSCVMPSYYINQHPEKLHKKIVYEYTQDYNKTSIKKINNKVIKKAQENPFLKKVSIYDFLYIASILKCLLFDKRDFVKIVDLIKPYHLKLKEIESIIKIDKIKKTKNPLTGKQRTILKEMLGVDE